MKVTGMSRHLDPLGRIVIPIELRRTLGINTKDSLAIFTHEDQIILLKHHTGCLFCGEVDDTMLHFHGEEVCPSCGNEMTDVLVKSQVAATDQA